MGPLVVSSPIMRLALHVVPDGMSFSGFSGVRAEVCRYAGLPCMFVWHLGGSAVPATLPQGFQMRPQFRLPEGHVRSQVWDLDSTSVLNILLTVPNVSGNRAISPQPMKHGCIVLFIKGIPHLL